MWLYLGSRSTPLKDKPEESTHSWTCYIKFQDPKQLELLERVIFKLHESFSNPLRSILAPPFEVNETGWGEFEIQVRLFFKDQLLKPVTLYHMLKLYSDSEDSTQDSVISERLERITCDSGSIPNEALPEIFVPIEEQEFARLESSLSSMGLLS